MVEKSPINYLDLIAILQVSETYWFLRSCDLTWGLLETLLQGIL